MKSIKLTEEAIDALQSHFNAFKQKFGREPRPWDPIFFDPDADEPRLRTVQQLKRMQDDICEAMRHAGIDPAKIFAYRKTGRIVTSENVKLLTRADVKEWNDAIDEYHSLH